MTARERAGWLSAMAGIWLLSVAMGAHAVAVHGGVWAAWCPVLEMTR